MKDFFLDIKNSFYSRDFYQKAIRKTAWENSKLVFKFLFLATLFLVIIILMYYFFFGIKYKSNIINYVEEHYPENLTITIENNTLSTNTEEGLVIFPIPSELKNTEEDEKIKNYFLVLAEKETRSSLDLLSEYETYFLITQSNVFSDNSRGEFSSKEIKFKNKSFTKNEILTYIEKAFRIYIPVFVILAIPFLFLFLTFFSLSYVLVLLLVSLLLMFFFKNQKINYSFSQIFSMGIPTIIPAILVNILLMFTGISFVIISGLVMMMILLYVNKENPILDDINTENKTEEINIENKDYEQNNKEEIR